MTEERAQTGLGAERDRLGAALGALALLIVLLHATQGGLTFGGGADKLSKDAGVVLTPADLLLGLAVVLWGARRIVRRDWSWPPVTAALLGACWLGLSLVPQFKGGDDLVVRASGVKHVLQFAEYFVVGVIVFYETLRCSCRRRWAVMALIVVTAAAVLAALAQYAGGTPVSLVRGTAFGNRNTFGCFLALSLPLLFGVALFARSWPLQLGVAALVLGGLCVTLSGGVFLALVVGLLVAAWLRGRWAFAAVAVALALTALVLLPRLPRQNSQALLDSVLLYKEGDPYAVFREDVLKIDNALTEKRRALGEKVVHARPVTENDLVQEGEYSWKWQQRYKEWQAAVNMTGRSPVFGVGAGAYQRNVNQFYNEVPKYPKNLMEPDALSFYFVWAASAGLPFLLFCAAMVLGAATAAARAYGALEDAWDRGLAAGVLGSLAAVVVACVFTSPFVRGVGVTLAFVLALAWVLDAARGEKRP